MIIRSIDAIIRMLDADYIENGNIEEKLKEYVSTLVKL